MSSGRRNRAGAAGPGLARAALVHPHRDVPLSPAYDELDVDAVGEDGVDLPQEFVNMILTQRSFQINSRVITVADQMYSIAANLK